MLKRTVTVKHKYGIHARPATKIVTFCKTMESEIEIVKDGEAPANGKNILDIMMLAAGTGEKLELRIDGPDEEAAMEQLALMMESDFDTNEI